MCANSLSHIVIPFAVSIGSILETTLIIIGIISFILVLLESSAPPSILDLCCSGIKDDKISLLIWSSQKKVSSGSA
jgi:hypothetical protein